MPLRSFHVTDFSYQSKARIVQKFLRTAIEINTRQIKTKLFLALNTYRNSGCAEESHEKFVDNKSNDFN